MTGIWREACGIRGSNIVVCNNKNFLRYAYYTSLASKTNVNTGKMYYFLKGKWEQHLFNVYQVVGCLANQCWVISTDIRQVGLVSQYVPTSSTRCSGARRGEKKYKVATSMLLVTNFLSLEFLMKKARQPTITSPINEMNHSQLMDLSRPCVVEL